jgi:hypothetical protein
MHLLNGHLCCPCFQVKYLTYKLSVNLLSRVEQDSDQKSSTYILACTMEFTHDTCTAGLYVIIQNMAACERSHTRDRHTDIHILYT